jgi:ribonuclease HI
MGFSIFTYFKYNQLMKQKNIIAYTDGSSRGNPGPGGWGAVLWYPDETVLELGGREDNTTNNKMELTAAIRALQGAGEIEAPMKIFTDSKYVREGILNWVHGWQKNGWKTKNKEDVSNKDLWLKLVDAMESRKVYGAIEWVLVPGHSGTPGNERADTIATKYADMEEAFLYAGPYGEYEHDLAEPNKEALKVQAEKRSAARARANAKAYSYLSLVDGKVMRHATWAECEVRVKGKSARYKKSLSKENEQEILDEWGVAL